MSKRCQPCACLCLFGHGSVRRCPVSSCMRPASSLRETSVAHPVPKYPSLGCVIAGFPETLLSTGGLLLYRRALLSGTNLPSPGRNNGKDETIWASRLLPCHGKDETILGLAVSFAVVSRSLQTGSLTPRRECTKGSDHFKSLQCSFDESSRSKSTKCSSYCTHIVRSRPIDQGITTPGPRSTTSTILQPSKV